MNQNKRIFLFAGHYGSGKTNLAVNWAFHLRQQGQNVTIADLDIVNPYFRTKDSEKDLREAGIGFICSEFANTNLDLPALPSEIYRLVDHDDFYAIFDIGGDDRGALALGRYTPSILKENRFEMWFVVNFCRPLTTDAVSAFEVMKEIESAGGLGFTGIINNTNIGRETNIQTILDSNDTAHELSELAGVPLVMTTVATPPISKVDYEYLTSKIPNLFSINLQKNILI